MATRKRKVQWLKKGDTVVTAFFETNGGPGWINTALWVIVQDGDKNLRREALQKEDYGSSESLMTLKPYSVMLNRDMWSLVTELILDMPKGSSS